MLTSLEIQNIAIIEKTSIDFKHGFNVLTGETGAGKSIIIDSINSILGSRASRDLIRNGCDKASVIAVFDNENEELNKKLIEMGIEIENDQTLILHRVINTSGKNVCRINGQTVTLSMLKQIGEYLVDVHGQHDNQSLLRENSHISILDSFGDDEFISLMNEYKEQYKEYIKYKSKLDNLMSDDTDREREIDILKYQINEIEEACLYEDEDVNIEQKLKIYDNSENIKKAFASVSELLNGDSPYNALDTVDKALQELNSISTYNSEYDSIIQELQNIFYRLEDISRDIRDKRDSMEYDEEEHIILKERIDIINQLKRKYGHSITEILAYLSLKQQELNQIINSEKIIEDLKLKIAKKQKKLGEISNKIDLLRRKYAKFLESKIKQALAELEMKSAKFHVDITKLPENEFLPNGINNVRFLIATNVGENLKPLSKIASGGEMSRIMLAIKSIIADIDNTPVLIFDEIDTGVSGKTAGMVGKKLYDIAKNHQVLCVTHHASIAAKAHNHYLISKNVIKDRTITEVKYIDKQNRVKEIARLLGDESGGDAALKLSREMLGE